MSGVYLRWACPICDKAHTREIMRDRDGVTMTVRTFQRPDVDYSQVRLIDCPGDQVYVLPMPLDLSCDAPDPRIPDERIAP